MKFRKIVIFIAFFLIVLNQVFSNLFFSEILPNTDDDATLEYIELHNSSDTVMYLSGYILKDKSGKEFIFNNTYLLNPYEKKKYFRSETKILLNDTDEQLFLYDNFGNLLDSYNYLTTENGIAIVIGHEIIQTQTGTVLPENNLNTQTGTTDTQSGITDTQQTIDTQSGTTLPDTQTGIIDTITQTGITDNSTGSTQNEMQQTILVPEVDYIFQSPSYLLEKDDIVSIYNCDTTKEECKINLDLSDSFVGGFKITDFSCELNFGFETGEENKCNPTTIIVPVGIYDFTLKIKSKINPELFTTKTFKVVNKGYIKPVSTGSNIYINNIYTDNSKINIAKPNIIVQNGLNDQNECTNKKSCSVNFLYQTKNSKERCIWDFGGGVYENGIEYKCNPGYVKYSNGEFLVKLKVFEDGNENNYNQNDIKFYNYPALTIISTDKKVEQKDKKEENKIEKTEKNKELLTIKTNIDKKSSLQAGSIKINKIMPNPSGNDDEEYIEIINKGNQDADLSSCSLDDIVVGGSKAYVFGKDDIIKKGDIKKYTKEKTKLNLNNANDEVNLFCDNILFDKLSWNFKVKDGYYLDHSRLDIFSGQAKVLEIIDGDTLKVEFLSSKKVEKLRLIGIDTPETKDPHKTIQEFGQEASDYVNDVLKGEEITVEMDPNNFRDKYSRLLGFVYIDGESFNKKLIEQGYAKAYLNFDFKYKDEYKKAETIAKKNNLGIWAVNTESKEKVESKSLVSSKSKILKSVISIQSKATNKKIFAGSTVTCFDTCSINFDGSNSTGNIKKYSWDFGNGKKYDGKNPSNIKYEKFGNYKVYLAVSSDNGELNTSSIIVNFYKAPKKEKTKKSIIPKAEGKGKNDKYNDKNLEQDFTDTQTDSKAIYYYVFLAIFGIVLVIMLLRKEKMI